MTSPPHDPIPLPATLISLSGLPGTGKTTIARELARDLAAVYLQVNEIAASLRHAGWRVEGEEYCVAHAVAEDNLRLGRIVIADSINPWPHTRAEWRAVAERSGAAMVDVEVVCSDEQEHKRRVAIRGTRLPDHTWAIPHAVAAVDYCAWDRERTVVDSARLTVEQSVAAILAAVLSGQRPLSGIGGADTTQRRGTNTGVLTRCQDVRPTGSGTA